MEFLTKHFDFWLAYHVLQCIAIAGALLLLLLVIGVLLVVKFVQEQRWRGWWLSRERRKPGADASGSDSAGERSISSPPGASSGALPGGAPMRWCPVCEEYHR
jgi:hypothetical protein